MKKLTKILAAAVLLAPLLTGAGVALASTPVLSVTQNGNSITLSISGAGAGSPVYLFQRQSASNFTESASLGSTDGNGNFTSPSQTINFDGSPNPVLLYVMVNGVSFPNPSTPLQIPPGTCASGCASGTLSLSQTSVAINSPSSITVTASPSGGGSVYVTGNTNSSVANVFASSDSIIITGEVTGSTTVTVCSTTSTSQCGSIFVSVNGGSSTTLNFSNQNPIVIAGQSSNITIFSPSNTNSSNYYISSNSNSNVVTSPSISGSTLYFSGGVPGTSTLTICQSNPSYCGTVTVTVGSNGSGGMSISPNTLTLTVGNTGSATISNTVGAVAITNNSNSSEVSASVSNVSGQTSQTVTVYAQAPGSSTLTICPVGSSSGCVYLYVQVGSNSSGSSSGGISFSVPNPVMTIGQSQSIAIYSTNGVSTYSVSNNSSANVASLSLSGSSLYLVGQNLGSSSITICQTSSTVCGTLYVTVNGSGSGLTLNPSSLNVAQNQSSTVTITGGSGTYYVSSNTNPSAAAVSIQGANIYTTGLNSGSSSVSVCDNSNSSICSTLLVTVGTSSTGTGIISFSNSAPVMTVGQSQSITISGGNSSSYYISSISNPGVVSLNLSGSLLNLTGTSLGSSSVSICQTGGSACASLNVTVNTTGTSATSSGSVSFTSASLSAATLNQSYSFQLAAQGGLGSYNYSLTSGALPAGLTLSSGGLITGTPTVEGSYSFTLEVADSGGTNQSLNFTLAVNPAGSLTIPGAPSLSVPAVGSAPTTYNNGELINENGTISIVYQNTKTPFANAPAFLGLGFSFANVRTVSNSGLPLSGKIVVTADGAHPRGSWLLSGSTVYFITPNGLIPVPSWAIFLSNGGQAGYIVPANSYDLSFPMLPLMTLNDARLQ